MNSEALADSIWYASSSVGETVVVTKDNGALGGRVVATVRSLETSDTLTGCPLDGQLVAVALV
jgi:hypothetical protein